MVDVKRIDESTPQQIGEGEVAEVVGRHDGLVTVGSVPPPRAGAVNVPVGARVVDEEVDLLKLGVDLFGKAFDVLLR